MLNEKQIQEHWKNIRGGVRSMWGKISEEDLDFIDGDINKLRNLLHKKYNESDEGIEEEINKVLSSYDNESDLADHDTNKSSYMRRPENDITQVRTSSKSQVQDKIQERTTNTKEREAFDKKSNRELDH